MGGVNLIYGMGMLDLGMTFSYEQLVMDNEIAGMVNRTLYGVPVNEDTIALDVIEKVGPAGTFLGEKHTMQYMDIEQSHAKLWDRTMRGAWNAAGKPMINDVANAKVKEILENHKPEPLDEDVQKQLKAIVDGR